MATVRQAWEDESERWADWARTPGHDHFFWRFNWPAFTALLPPAGRATLDLGCGEGRGGRLLAEQGHRVTGIDGSPTLAALARDAGGYDDVLVADAAALPFAGDAFDLVVAFMTLHDIDDHAGALREVARVLAPGGRLCAAIVHPFRSVGFGEGDGSDYLGERRFTDRLTLGEKTMTFHGYHRPIAAYTGALRDAGLALLDLREPVPDAGHVADHPELRDATRVPMFLHLAAAVA